MSFFPPLTRQKYGWLEASYAAAPATTRRWYHLHGRRPDLDAAYVSRESERAKEENGRGSSMVRVAQGAGGRAAVCTQVMSYKKREGERRVLCNDEFGGRRRRRLPSGFPLGGGRLKQARSAFCSAGWMDGRAEKGTL